MDDRSRSISRRAALGALVGTAALGGVFIASGRGRQSLTPLQLRGGARGTYNPPVRVSLTSSPVKEMRVSVDGAFHLRPIGSTRNIASADKLADSKVTPAGGGFRIGDKTYPVSRLEIVPERSPSIWAGGTLYRGTIRLVRQSSTTFYAVNVLPLEEYIASVIDGETPTKFPRAAREAQGIVARTYALYHAAGDAPHPTFDLYATTKSQRYLGYQYRSGGRLLAGETEVSRQIAADTAGMVCTWKGRIFCTYFAAVCGGRTSPGRWFFADAAPPLQSVECDWCKEADLYRWTATIKKTDFANRAWPRDTPAARNVSIRPGSKGDATHEPTFTATDGRKTRELRGSELRTMFSQAMHSPHVEIADKGDAFELNGRGHGHGAGLCQWGARGLALAGRDAFEIVRHYYPGANIVTLEAPRA